MSAWSYRKAITVDSAKVDADLTDFPVVIHLDSDSDLAERAQASGDDIKFEDPNGTQLSHEIESYDGSTGTLWAHVKVPSLLSTSDTTIYLYYGNPDAANQESVADVWSNGYEAVYHLDESASGTGNTDIYKDSTANNHHGDDLVSDTSQTGRIYQGQEFDGSDDYVEVGDIGVTGKWTVTFWGATFTQDTVMYPVATGSDPAAIDIGEFDGNGVFFYDGFNIIGDGGSYSLGTTTRVSVTQDTGTYGIFRDGALKNTGAGISTDLDAVNFGRRADDNWYTDCFVDEVRMSSVARSDAWISTAYTSQTDPLSFYSVGPEESAVVSKSAVVAASSNATASSPQTDTRDVPTSAVAETSISATARRPADASTEATATTDLATALQTPSIAALTPTALTTEVVTTTTEQTRASVTTARSTVTETKPRVFKFADATAAATTSVAVSVPTPTTPATALITASPRAALMPRETTPHRRALDKPSDTDAAYQTASDRVRYDERTDEIEYNTR
jgi:hypothetical protein